VCSELQIFPESVTRHSQAERPPSADLGLALPNLSLHFERDHGGEAGDHNWLAPVPTKKATRRASQSLGMVSPTEKLDPN
jgi:hypothetical protein